MRRISARWYLDPGTRDSAVNCARPRRLPSQSVWRSDHLEFPSKRSFPSKRTEVSQSLGSTIGREISLDRPRSVC